jgi:hypothetical protein
MESVFSANWTKKTVQSPGILRIEPAFEPFLVDRLCSCLVDLQWIIIILAEPECSGAERVGEIGIFQSGPGKAIQGNQTIFAGGVLLHQPVQLLAASLACQGFRVR